MASCPECGGVMDRKSHRCQGCFLRWLRPYLLRPSTVRQMSDIEAAWVGAMIEGEGTIRADGVSLSNTEIEKLLFDFLNELVYFKDAELLLFSKVRCSVKKVGNKYTLAAALKGEKIDTKRHKLKNDVKAVTWHMFEIKKQKDGYRALVIVDV